MRPVPFKYATGQLEPPAEAQYSENIEGIDPLPVWTDGEQCVSCWQMSLRERISALLFGRVWLAVLGGKTQPPVYAECSKSYFRETD